MGGAGKLGLRECLSIEPRVEAWQQIGCHHDSEQSGCGDYRKQRQDSEQPCNGAFQRGPKYDIDQRHKEAPAVIFKLNGMPVNRLRPGRAELTHPLSASRPHAQFMIASPLGRHSLPVLLA